MLLGLAAADRFGEHPLVYLAMPFIAAIIGYVTKIAAIEMMFSPIEFKGIGKLGWQGIIPKRAAKMASITVDTMTRDLISAKEIIERLDPQRIAKEIEAPLLASIDKIGREVLAEYQPGLWESLPEGARRLLISRVQSQSPQMVARLMADLKENIDEVFDLKHMAVSNLLKDKPLLNRMFREIGYKEFRFIRNSGLYFGFVIGLFQAVTYAFVEQPWVLPAFGVFVGYSTDWLALKMLFHPTEPKKILGVTFHGLFLKRQEEVSRDYATLLAKDILTPKALFEELLKGPYSDQLFVMVQKQAQEVIDKQSGIAKPLVVFAVGSRQYQEMKRAVAVKLVEELPSAMAAAETYTAEAMDIEATIVQKMQGLSSHQFERILHPAFEADEWILIVVGAALGFLVGLSQDLVLVPLFRSLS